MSRSEIATADLKGVLGMEVREPPARFAVGQVLDRAYRIDAEIGVGGMGRVYRAHDIRLRRDVAIKLHTLTLVDGRHWSLREAAALARLSHPNVVTVFEVGEWAGHPWVAMEYVPGGTARSWLAARARTPREILALYVAAGRGLAAAHAAGIVHRDFKPDNVLVTTDDQPRVADFGVALVGDAPATASLAVGTPGYMAPEQWRDEDVGPAADQFAFGVVVWEALTGARPFLGATDDELRAAFDAPLAAPARPLPRHVEAALRRALAIAPDERWPALEPLLRELARDPQRTRRWAVGIAVASVAFVGAGVVLARVTGADVGEVEPPCARATAALDPARAARSALARPGDRALPKLDAWLAHWQRARMAACTDTHVARTQPLAMLELRELCLDRLRGAVEATLHELAAPKADAVALVEALPPISECEDLRQLANTPPLPVDPALRAEIQEVTRQLVGVDVTRAAGRTKEALAAAIALAPRARATGRKSLVAYADMAHATLLVATGTYDVAHIFERAALAAAEGRDDFYAALAWAHLLDLYIARLEQPAKADVLLPVVEAMLARAGKPPMLHARVLGLKGEIAKQRGDLPGAAGYYAEALALHELAKGQDSELARKLNRLATIQADAGELDQARASIARAAKVLEDLYGPRYRHLAVIWTTLGGIEERAKNWAAARGHLERAVALKEEVSGRDSVTLVPTLTTLASVLAEQGEVDLALAAIDRAIRIGTKVLGDAHAKVTEAKQIRAKVLAKRVSR